MFLEKEIVFLSFYFLRGDDDFYVSYFYVIRIDPLEPIFCNLCEVYIDYTIDFLRTGLKPSYLVLRIPNEFISSIRSSASSFCSITSNMFFLSCS